MDDMVYIPASFEKFRVSKTTLKKHDRVCSICSVEYGTSEDGNEAEFAVRLPSCKHKAHHFGNICLSKWLTQSSTCPIDRKVMKGLPKSKWVVKSRAQDKMYNMLERLTTGDFDSRLSLFDENSSAALSAFFELVDGAVQAHYLARDIGKNIDHGWYTFRIQDRVRRILEACMLQDFKHLGMGTTMGEDLTFVLGKFVSLPWPGAESAFWELVDNVSEVFELDEMKEDDPGLGELTEVGIKMAVLRFLTTFSTDDEEAWVPVYD